MGRQSTGWSPPLGPPLQGLGRNRDPADCRISRPSVCTSCIEATTRRGAPSTAHQGPTAVPRWAGCGASPAAVCVSTRDMEGPSSGDPATRADRCRYMGGPACDRRRAWPVLGPACPTIVAGPRSPWSRTVVSSVPGESLASARPRSCTVTPSGCGAHHRPTLVPYHAMGMHGAVSGLLVACRLTVLAKTVWLRAAVRSTTAPHGPAWPAERASHRLWPRCDRRPASAHAASNPRPPAGRPGRNAAVRPANGAPAGWHLGRRAGRRGPELWVPYDRTTGVIGPQGSGKTLDLLAPALLDAPGAALVTLTKPDDLFSPSSPRAGRHGPVAVLDPFDLAPGSTRAGVGPDRRVRRTRCWPNGARRRSPPAPSGRRRPAGDQAARFYAGECAKVLQAYFHAAALAGLRPRGRPGVGRRTRANTSAAEEILRTHPDAEPLWDGLLRGALHGDDRTAGNTITTVQQALALFFQDSIRDRCVPAPGRPATDLTELIRAGGTIYLLGREDPYASRLAADDRGRRARPRHRASSSARPRRTAGSARRSSPAWTSCPPPRRCPPWPPGWPTSEPSGSSFILAAQTWRQLVRLLRRGRGPHHPRTQQQPRRLRRRQGHRLLPRDVRPRSARPPW